ARPPAPPPPPVRREPARTPRRVAFLTHLLGDRQLADLDPSLARLPAAALAGLLDRTARVWDPVVLDQVHVHSPTGADVHLTVLGLGVTARQIVRAMHARDTAWILGKLEAAVAAAVGRGCRAVGFGGYTSIVAHNCKRVAAPGAAVTTGNSLTVGMGLRAIEQAAREAGLDLGRARVGVVGATGNIASTYAQLVAPRVREVVLVGRDRASPRLAAVAAEVGRAAPGTRVVPADDCAALVGCDLVVAASNTPDPLIFPRHLGPGPVVICDISLPPDVSDDVVRARPDVRVIRGGVVRLPLDPGFSVAGVGVPPGHALACMAETLLMGLDEATAGWSVGPVTAAGVGRALAAADAHGFAVAATDLLTAEPVGRFFDDLRGRPRPGGETTPVRGAAG
ncbi:MAG: hypothetical protein JWO38_2359, partial [Gemmataceae bacterium]|nr:hypothetical protein [Gemmataceae bacterium]